MSVILLVEIGGETHPITITRRPITLGRSTKCNVRFSDNMMSSKHCEILLNENYRVVVKDLNSSNGTYINDSKVEAGHVFIGDKLKIGNIVMHIDTSKLTPHEKKALTDVNVKRSQKFVDLKNKKNPGKTKLMQDFTQINMVIPKELGDDDQKTFIMNQGAVASAKKNKTKVLSKKKSKIINKDKTGFFKKIFKKLEEDKD